MKKQNLQNPEIGGFFLVDSRFGMEMARYHHEFCLKRPLLLMQCVLSPDDPDLIPRLLTLNRQKGIKMKEIVCVCRV